MIPRRLGSSCAQARKAPRYAPGARGATRKSSASAQSAVAPAFHPALSGPCVCVCVCVAPASWCEGEHVSPLWSCEDRRIQNSLPLLLTGLQGLGLPTSSCWWAQGVGPWAEAAESLFLPKVVAVFHEQTFLSLLFTFGWFLKA